MTLRNEAEAVPAGVALERLAAWLAEGNDDPETDPDWSGKCDSCGASPIVPATGLCGPCTFGDASTAGGNW